MIICRRENCVYDGIHIFDTCEIVYLQEARSIFIFRNIQINRGAITN